MCWLLISAIDILSPLLSACLALKGYSMEIDAVILYRITGGPTTPLLLPESPDHIEAKPSDVYIGSVAHNPEVSVALWNPRHARRLDDVLVIHASHSRVSCRLCFTLSMDDVGVYQGELLFGDQINSILTCSSLQVVVTSGSRLRQGCMQLPHFSIYMCTTWHVSRSTSSRLRDPRSRNLPYHCLTPSAATVLRRDRR